MSKSKNENIEAYKKFLVEAIPQIDDLAKLERIVNFIQNNCIDFKKVFDAHYPIIAATREVRKYYKGDIEKKLPPRICSEVVGELIIALNACERIYKFVIEAKEIKDEAKESNKENENEKGEAVRPDDDGSEC